MYDIFFYRDHNGREPVKEHILELKAQNSKDSRIKLNKILDYMKILEIYGTRAGEPFVKHLEDDIWELRPLSDRILFAAWIDNSFILLCQFRKKTSKTPKREIDKARRLLADFRERSIEK